MPLPRTVVRALQEMHPDPFVQAAILKVYQEAPGLLDSSPYVTLAQAHGLDWDQITKKRHAKAAQ